MASKLLLVVIDAATPYVVCPAIQTGRLPTMQRLAEAGDIHQATCRCSGSPCAIESATNADEPDIR